MASPHRKVDPVRKRRRRAPVAVVPDLVPVVPSPPVGVLKATREGWEAFWSDGQLADLVKPADVLALRELFALYDEAARCRAEFRRGGRYTEGSTGQRVLSPAAKWWESLQKAIRPLEDRFGLTPRARFQLLGTLGPAAESLERLNALAADPVGEELGEDPRDVLDV